MPIRNPFARRPVLPDEHPQPAEHQDAHCGFERVVTVGTKASSLSACSSQSHDTGEYKMSVVNDSGVYLPPSPSEEKDQWPPRRYLSSRTSRTSRASTDTRSSSGDLEHFPISRESFDSYRRSFDVTARSPIVSNDSFGRQSLDSARFPRLPRSAMAGKFDCQPPTAEEGFEDVGLDDHKQQPRKRGFFSKLTESQDASGQPTVSRFLMSGRKRGHSGQGAELTVISQNRDN
ncbi:hypothetical protein E4U13_002030 [Claviceps humidiphila]|uniref:Uncharacterized protein n=1 Tax=Claviceps humidiphila TaxID=1294629 RepID=A0A9P7TXK6_9HYPO|nr:hypothetical protein E4U13_002030 [Claviceps humidiphila]